MVQRFTFCFVFAMTTSVQADVSSVTGLRFLLNKDGINVWKRVADEEILKILSELKLSEYKREEGIWPVNYVSEKLTNVEVYFNSFNRSQSTLQIEQGINKPFVDWNMGRFNVGVSADYSTKSGKFSAIMTGTLQALMELNLIVKGALASKGGGVTVPDDTTVTCSTLILTQPVITVTTGANSDIYNARDRISNYIQQQLKSSLCQTARPRIRTAIDESLQTHYPTSLTVFGKLQLDNRILKAGYANTTSTIIVESSGRVSSAAGNMSLISVPFPTATVPQNKQALIQISEPVLRSALYAAAKAGLLDVNLDEDFLHSFFKHDRQFLSLNCTESRSSLGCVIPKLAEKYPNGGMDLRLLSSATPTVSIQSEDNSLLFHFESDLEISVSEILPSGSVSKIKALVASTVTELSIADLKIKNRFLKGSVSLKLSKLSMSSPTVDSDLVDWAELNEIWQALSLLLGDTVFNERFSNEGVLLDRMVQGISLVDLQLQVAQRMLRLSGNFAS